ARARRSTHHRRDAVRGVDVRGGLYRGQAERAFHLGCPATHVRDSRRELVPELADRRDIVFGVERLRRVAPRVPSWVAYATRGGGELAQLAHRRVERIA